MRAAIILGSAIAGLAAGPLAARPLEAELPKAEAACWERKYDAAHLAAHPAQKVARLRLVHLPLTWRSTEQRGFFVVIYFKLARGAAGEDFDHQISGFCKPAGKGVRCRPEWEAGNWRIESGPRGTLDIRNGGIVANPNPYDAEEIADAAVRIPAKPDDGLWRLSRATDACKIE